MKLFLVLTISVVLFVAGMGMVDVTESTEVTAHLTDAELRQAGVDPKLYRPMLWYKIVEGGGTVERAEAIAYARLVPYGRSMTPGEVASDHRIGWVLVLLSVAVPLWFWRRKLFPSPGSNPAERARARAEIAARKAARSNSI